MTPIRLLSEITATGGRVAASSYAEKTHFDTLLGHKLLRHDGIVGSIACINCADPHDAEILYHDGTTGYMCPELGFVSLTDGEVAAVSADTTAITSALADVFACRRRKSSPIVGSTWRIGSVSSEGGEIGLFFRPRMSDKSDASELLAVLSQEIRTQFRLIISADGTLPIPNATTVLLEDVVEFDPTSASFVAISDPIELVGAPRKNPGGAPNRYAQMLIPLIKARIENGTALEGRNAEAKAIHAILAEQKGNTKPPSLSTIQDYISKVRSGQ